MKAILAHGLGRGASEARSKPAVRKPQTAACSSDPSWAPMIAQFHRRVGEPDKDVEFLWSRSPLSRADQISIPLLLGGRAED